MFDIIIIGAGIAGLTSAIYSARAGKKVLVLDKLNYGGQIINSPKIENYPGYIDISGFELATNLFNQVKALNVEVKFEEVIRITSDKEVLTNKNRYNTKAIIIATGLNSKKLNLENEEKYIGRGLSYCAICDGNFFKDKEVAVVGGGNVALEDALYLSNLCKIVHLIHRRNEFKADNIHISKIRKKDNIIIHYNTVVNKVIGKNSVEAIELKENNKTELLNVDGLFIAIGREPNNKLFSDLVDVDDEGYIISNDDCRTSNPFIFVAGDCKTKKVRQLVTAANDGAIAAISAVNYLEGEK